MQKLIWYLNQFSPLSDETACKIQHVFKEDELKKDQFFIKENEYAHDIAFLQSGVVRAFYTNKDGKDYNKTFFVGPAVIGSYGALISKQKNQLPQQALTDCRIWRAKYSAIEALSENNLEIERLRRAISERFFVLNEKKQVEMALLEAKDRYAIFQAEHPGIEGLIPQYHIASYLGISPTQLSRIRQQAS